MLSKDGERVVLDTPIAVSNEMNVKDWLLQVESRIHTTLAKKKFDHRNHLLHHHSEKLSL